MDWIFFAQVPDPQAAAQAISQQGLAYILVVVALIAGTCIGFLFRALTTEKDKRREDAEAHAKHVETLYEKQVAMGASQDQTMDKILAALEKVGPRGGQAVGS